jgi:hypothetical protein
MRELYVVGGEAGEVDREILTTVSGAPIGEEDPFVDHSQATWMAVDRGQVDELLADGGPVAIKQLKEQPGTDIVRYGFDQLSHTLMENGLLDELRLWIHPVFVGKGGAADLLYRDCPLATFDLVDTMPLKSGIVILSYAASADPAAS